MRCRTVCAGAASSAFAQCQMSNVMSRVYNNRDRSERKAAEKWAVVGAGGNHSTSTSQERGSSGAWGCVGCVYVWAVLPISER